MGRTVKLTAKQRDTAESFYRAIPLCKSSKKKDKPVSPLQKIANDRRMEIAKRVLGL